MLAEGKQVVGLLQVIVSGLKILCYTGGRLRPNTHHYEVIKNNNNNPDNLHIYTIDIQMYIYIHTHTV